MADFHSTGWVAGETVTARAVSATPPGASGATVASGSADTAGAVDFTGLATETDFRATGGTSGRSVNFRIGLPPQTAQTGSSVFLVEDPDTGLPDRPNDAAPRIWEAWSDPTTRMADGDLLIVLPEPEGP